MSALETSLWPAEAGPPVRDTTVGSILREAAAECPGRTAVIAWGLAAGERRAWTYAELGRDAERTARALLARFQPGEHVAVYAPNLPEWLLLELGAGRAPRSCTRTCAHASRRRRRRATGCSSRPSR